MKALLVAVFMTLGLAFSASASGSNTVLVEKRANNLSDQMIRELRLNNYQSNEVRAINTEVIAKMVAVENEFKGNQELIDQKIKGILAERDKVLEDVLSTVQYNKYFGKRPDFRKLDQEFVAKVNTQDTNNSDAMSAAATEAVTVN